MVKWSVFLAFVGFALVIDLVTKRLAENHLAPGEIRKVLPFLSLERTANTGAAFGLLGGKGALIIAANVVALVVVVLYVRFERRAVLAGIGGGLIVGGSLGNVVQRLTANGNVTDFIKFPHWPNYNMADVFIFLGIAVIVVGLIWEASRLWKAGHRSPTPR